MKTTDLFETTECSRCGGEGRYSYNQIDGDICYGCNGSGWQLTAAGSEARKAWIAAYTVTVKAQDIKAGDKVMVDDPMRGREFCRLITSSTSEGSHWMLRWENGGWGTSPDKELRVPATSEDKRAAYETIENMPGALGWEVAAT